MGPDEYKPVSNNNAYTNFTAKLNLELVEKVVNMAKHDAPDVYQAVCEKISFNEAEIQLFNEIAGGLSISVTKSGISYGSVMISIPCMRPSILRACGRQEPAFR